MYIIMITYYNHPFNGLLGQFIYTVALGGIEKIPTVIIEYIILNMNYALGHEHVLLLLYAN